MTDKPAKEQISPQEEEQSGGILLWLLLGILLVMLVGGGVAFASYLGLFSLDDLANKARQLPHRIPVVNKFFPAESSPEQTAQTEGTSDVSATPPAAPPAPLTAVAPNPQTDPQQNPGVKQLSPQEAAAAEAKARAEEAKNISRLARLYASMKPEEAAPIIKALDDDMIVSLLRKMEDEQAAKILTVMEPERAAKLTRLLAGKQKTYIQVN